MNFGQISQRYLVNYIVQWYSAEILTTIWQEMIFKSSPLDKIAAISQTTFLKCIFINEEFCISIQISLKFVPKGPIDNNSVLV